MKNKKILTLVFLCVIIVVAIIGRRISLSRSQRPGSKDERPKVRRKKAKKSKTEELSLEKILGLLEKREKEPFLYKRMERRDPFDPLILKKAPGGTVDSPLGIKLKGVLWDPEDPLAEIEISGVGTRIIHIGDLIKGGKIIPKDETGGVQGGIKVLDIQKDRIILQDAGGRKTEIKLKR
jgi:hypothetical protein